MAVLNGSSQRANGSLPNIIDIRREPEAISLADALRHGLNPPKGHEQRIPSIMLYDERGLKLFEAITYLEEYYPTESEIEVLKTYADDIAKWFKPDTIMLELGSGNLRKINILLQAIEKRGVDMEYYALDLSLPELERTISAIDHDSFRHVKIFGLYGTYADGLVWLQSPSNRLRPKVVLSLGSSIGNFRRSAAAEFLAGFANVISTSDSMLVGLDACQDPKRVYHAYNDREGTTHAFIRNGLKHCNHVLQKEAFNLEKWRVIGEYSAEEGRHQVFVSPSEDVVVEGVLFKANARLGIEESHKYSTDQSAKLWASAGAYERRRWSNQRNDYALHALSKTMGILSRDPESYAATPVPLWAEWVELWKLWDTVTRDMIPNQELLSKPIKLRNVCLFYLGHIPTFLDMKITDTLKGNPTEPAFFQSIFERGIDPDVDNPATVHAHSEIPEEWPSLSEILDFQGRVRQRVKDLYTSNAYKDIDVGRCLWLGYEHECMHLETLLYMLLQSDKTLPPPTDVPDFKILAQKAKSQAVPNQWFHIPEREVTLGLDDPEKGSDAPRYYGWDIEKPARKTSVKAFSAKARPITNGEYARFLEETNNTTLPASWTVSGSTANAAQVDGTNNYTNGASNGATNGATNGAVNGAGTDNITHRVASSEFIEGKFVRSVYGPVPLKYALDWPVAASFDELSQCAAWMGGRIPSVEEAQSIYAYVDQRRRKEAPKTLNETTPAVNGHLSNDGVEETPPSNAKLLNGATAPSPRDIHVDLHDCNVGFEHWHPIPVTQNGGRLSGLGDLGGVWEWTSSALDGHEGFEPMTLYPVYSADFFDRKHNVVLGGSWATPPRIAGRKTFVNWYQRNYPYAVAGARVVKDI